MWQAKADPKDSQKVEGGVTGTGSGSAEDVQASTNSSTQNQNSEPNACTMDPPGAVNVTIQTLLDENVLKRRSPIPGVDTINTIGRRIADYSSYPRDRSCSTPRTNGTGGCSRAAPSAAARSGSCRAPGAAGLGEASREESKGGPGRNKGGRSTGRGCRSVSSRQAMSRLPAEQACLGGRDKYAIFSRVVG